MSLGTVRPLRQRMIEDMTIRQLGEKTQHDYVRVARDFAAFLGRSPDLAEPEDLRRYQLHLASYGASQIKTMTLPAEEFLRRFLLHVLPSGFHRIRHYGLLAAGARTDIGRIRTLIDARPSMIAPADQPADDADEQAAAPEIACPCCGGRMRIIETFARGQAPNTHAGTPFWADSS